jgi:hypothetical protein
MDPSGVVLVVLVAMELAIAFLVIRAPVELRLSFTLGANGSGVRAVSWYGPFSVTGAWGAVPGDRGLQVRFAGRKVPIPAISERRKRARPQDRKTPPGPAADEQPWSGRIIRFFQVMIPHFPGMLRALIRWSVRVLRLTTSWDGSLKISAGFDDPALTGVVYGTVAAMRPVLKTCRFDLSMVPDFNVPCLGIDASAHVRIRYPVVILLAIPALATDRAVLNGIRALHSSGTGLRATVKRAAPGVAG